LKTSWAILISGRGSNLAALLELREEINIRVVLSSKPDAHGLLKARRAGIESGVVPMNEATQKIDWQSLSKKLRDLRVTHIFLAGFMKIVPGSFVAEWQGRMLNLHPSLLPLYPGLNSIERAYADLAEIGVSVHRVVKDVDAGELICQRRSLNATEVRRYASRESAAGLSYCEFLVHVDEQRIIKESIRRCNLSQNSPNSLNI
jgi:phosphoribosylglycinamide formyltransferase-1